MLVDCLKKKYEDANQLLIFREFKILCFYDERFYALYDDFMSFYDFSRWKYQTMETSLVGFVEVSKQML